MCLLTMAVAEDTIVVFDAGRCGSASRSFLQLPEFDSTVTSDYVSHNVGRLPQNGNFESSDFLYRDSTCAYTELLRASDYFDVGSFPARTTVALFYADKGQWHKHGSGTMISPRHVLTAAHNVQYEARWWGEDSLLIVPALDLGKAHPEIGSTISTKSYYLTHGSTACCYGRSRHDFAVLRLRDPIGEKTGWLGYGFQPREFFSTKRMHWFSYPGVPPDDSSRDFNSDTMFYSTMLNPEEPCIDTRFTGIPGQSGSNVFCDTDGDYVIYWNMSTGFRYVDNKVFTLIRFAVSDTTDLWANHSIAAGPGAIQGIAPLRRSITTHGLIVASDIDAYNLIGRKTVSFPRHEGNPGTSYSPVLLKQ